VSFLNDLLADLTSGDESRAEAAASQLAQLGDSALIPLKGLLDSSDADHRWWAVRTLAQIPDVDAGLFLTALNDSSVEVRQAAALALATHPLEEAAPLLVRALNDADSMVQTLAANALIAIGRSVVPILLGALDAVPQSAQIQIMRALAEMRDHRAIPAMLKATESNSVMLNYWANEGLERLGLNMVYIKPE